MFAEQIYPDNQTSSLAASPVRTLARLVLDRVCAAHGVGFTWNWSASFATLDPGLLCWRTLQMSLFEAQNALLPDFPPQGMTASGSLYPLRQLSRTFVVDGSMWGTPTATDRYARKPPATYKVTPAGITKYITAGTNGSQMRLGQQVAIVEQHAGAACNPEWQLNPQWVEQLMGFPDNWTAISGPPGAGNRRLRTNHPGLRRTSRHAQLAYSLSATR